MAKAQIDLMGVGGGIDSLLSAMSSGSIITSNSSGAISVTNGKTYLCAYTRGTTTAGGIASGGTELYGNSYASGGNIKIYIGVIKATSNTLTFLGNNNPTYVAQLD